MPTATTALPDGRTRAVRLFAGDHPNLCWLHAFLEGRATGRVWAWPSLQDPQASLVAVGERYAFLAGAPAAELLQEVASALGDRPRVTVVVPRRFGLVALPLPTDFRVVRRTHFRTPAHRLLQALTEAKERAARQHIEALGLGVRRITPADFDDPLLTSTMTGIYGSRTGFAAGPDLGWCAVCADGRLASWLHPVIGGGVAEVGAAADPEHRGQGVTAMLNVITVRHLALAGHDVTASWEAQKTASRRLAAHVALEHQFDYDVLVRDA